MPTKIDESGLTKGEVRKLNALRKSLGPQIADKAFSAWLRHSGPADAGDPNIDILAEAIEGAVARHRMTFPRGGYLVKRGRGRVIITPAD